MTRSDIHNELKITVLLATTDVFKNANPGLFKALMNTNGEKLKPNTILSFCGNTRHLKTLGSYSKDTETCVGIYDKHMDLLNIVGFPWGNE